MQKPPVRSSRAPLAALLATLPLSLACPPPGGNDAGPDAGDGGPLHDAGLVEDGGADGGPDDAGSPDAGDPCATATYDDALGTLALESGFSVIDHAPLPADAWMVAPFMGPNDALHLASLSSESVVDLGAWPDLGESAPLFDVVPDDESSAERYVSGFLASNGVKLAAGYTLPFDTETFISAGKVAIGDASGVAYTGADNNFSATFLGNTLLITSTSAGEVSAGAGLYAVVEGESGLEGSQVATFPASLFASSGYAAVAGDVVVVGGFYAVGGAGPDNHLLALPSDAVLGALDSGTPLELDAENPFLSGQILGVTALEDSIAVIRGDFGAPEAVQRVSFSVDEGAISTTEPGVVLHTSDSCTSIDLVSSLGGDLLVGVTDVNGRRLVRIQQDG